MRLTIGICFFIFIFSTLALAEQENKDVIYIEKTPVTSTSEIEATLTSSEKSIPKNQATTYLEQKFATGQPTFDASSYWSELIKENSVVANPKEQGGNVSASFNPGISGIPNLTDMLNGILLQFDKIFDKYESIGKRSTIKEIEFGISVDADGRIYIVEGKATASIKIVLEKKGSN